ncbi:MAG: FecR domain-containing protein [Planctomycetia bacterium]|nr:FecR domain-containing protein [Planctomycetia bacterium]
MDCERAVCLLSAQIDREIAADDQSALQAHLADCATCRSVAESFQLQDSELRQGFQPLRARAEAVGQQVAAELRPATTPPTRSPNARFALVALLGTAALLALVYYWPQTPAPRPRIEPTPHVELVSAPSGPGYLAAKPRPAAPAPQPLTVGASLQTQAGQRRRLSLPDGSILYVNQQTALQLVSERRVLLTAGEVYVEVAPNPEVPFIVEARQREVRALGTRFSVRAEDGGPRVVVTQGTVQVSGLGSLLHAGQQLAPGGREVSTAPRASYLLDWTRELLAAAESALVPKSEHCGGSLVALDPNGQQAKLSLRQYRVDVHIEDGFARTTIDQTYFNHLPQRLEGTFYFPLPPDASLSRLAMYVVDGNRCTLNEGGMCERNEARQIFESIVTRMQDPALLEWVDGSTFKMRVFPLEGRQEKRIILGYTQKLDSLYGHTSYSFPAGHNMDRVGDWSLYVRVKGAAKRAWKSATHQLQAHADNGDLILEDQAENAKLDKDVQLSIADAADAQGARFSLAEHEGAKYLMLRYRPDLASAKPQAVSRKKTDWVFLFESAGDRDPLLARTQIDVIRTFLTNVNHDDTFTILTAATRVGKINEKQPVTPENVKTALESLEKVHLVGALDLGQALTAAEPFLKNSANPCLVHVGTGIPVLGERGEDVLARRLRADVPYVGIGVGKRWSRSFMKLAAERTGGAFAQINPDDEVSWRAFELFSTLRTARLQGVKVVDNAEQARFLTFTSTIAQGEEICAITRLADGAELPTSVSVAGTLDGKPFAVDLRVKDVADQAGYLPRTWAKLEIDRLLAENAAGNKPRIIDLSKKMYVMTPFTSLLVLENEAMYQQFNVDRGRKDHWALYGCPPHIPIVHEPLPNHVEVRQPPVVNAPAEQKPSAEQVLHTVLVRMPPRFFQDRQGRHFGHVLTAWQLLHTGYAVSDFGFDHVKKTKEIDNRLELFFEDDGVRQPGNRLGKFDRRHGGLPNDLPIMRPKADPKAEPAAERFDAKERDFGRLERRQDMRALREGQQNLDRLLRRQDSHLPLYRRGPGFQKDDAIRLELAGDPRGFFGRGLDAMRDMEEVGFAVGQKAAEGRGRRFGKFQLAEDLDGLQAVQQYMAQLFDGQGREVLHYHRPTFTGDERVFYDLVSYAPGMNTRRADILAVLEAEAQPTETSKRGEIDAEARQLIDRARQAGWEKLTFASPLAPGGRGVGGEGNRTPLAPGGRGVGGEGNRTPLALGGRGVGGEGDGSFSIVCDGAGRYVWERHVPHGLSERVVCDGQTLWHLYPEIAVGAQRSVSRFHRAELSALIPWLLPTADDLAHGADVKHLGERTIRVVPLGAVAARDQDGKAVPYTVTEYVFERDGRLAEQRVRQLPTDKLLSRETYAADGTVRRFAADDKEIAVVRIQRAAADAPVLAPKTDGLLVLPLPYRERGHIYRVHKINEFKDLSDVAARTVLASDFAAGQSGEMLRLLAERYQGDLKSVGIYTLLAASGVDVNDQPEPNRRGQYDCQSVLTRYGKQPLARYLAFMSNHGRRQQVGASKLDLAADGLLARLAGFRDLWMPWRNGTYPNGDEQARRKQFTEALAFVKHHGASPLAWAMLDTILSRGYWNEAVKLGLADALRQFENAPRLSYSVKYELARLALNDDRERARRLFAELYRDTLKQGWLPPIDHAIRQALIDEPLHDGQSNGWFELVRRTVDELFKDQQAEAVLALAWQVRQHGDAFLADEMLQRVLSETSDEQRLATTLAVLGHYWQTGQDARAEGLLQPFLDDAKTGDNPALWRLAAALAQRQQKLMRTVQCLDRALEIEYRQLPEVINLQTLRQDFAGLLQAYASVAQTYQSLEARVPADFSAKIIRLADRWRTLDPDGTQACQSAAVVLRAAGLKELAWDYLTTPIALRPNEGGTYQSLAQSLQGQNEIDLADKAYALAFETEPTNAQLLWERAQMLQQAGRHTAARQVYAQLADGKWQPRFHWLQQQARWQLGQRAGR